jgi:penicillin-binding protein 1A
LRVTPRLVRKVSNADGITLFEEPSSVNAVIEQPTARTMMTLLRAVIQKGTGAAASQLNHPLGGKTGTTSDYTDAWFLGFSPSVTCGVWVGFDSRESLGEKETGAKAALPIWIAVMRTAIVGKDNELFLGDKQTPVDPSKQQTATPAPATKPNSPPVAAKATKPANAIANGKPDTNPTAKSPAAPTTKLPAAPATSKPQTKPSQTPPATNSKPVPTPARSLNTSLRD